MYLPTILALDFDGVLCDGLLEYFQTTQLTYRQIWKHNHLPITDNLAPIFYRLRPVIETGWEMPILLRALILGVSEEKILQNWSIVSQQIIQSERLDSREIAHQLDSIRDRWIASDLEGWLKLHRFYPGVINRVREILHSSTKLYIITTKERRFVQQLLAQQGINLPQDAIIGKESKRPKYQTLGQIIQSASHSVDLWFVEDRLKALQLVQQQPDLQEVKLYLAGWGYNTQQMRDTVQLNPRIKLLSLEQFNQNFSIW